MMNVKSLFVLACILMASFAQAQDSLWLKDFTIKWKNNRLYIIELIESVPGDQMHYAPDTAALDIHDMVLHMCHNMHFLCRDYLGDQTEFQQPFGKRELNKDELLHYVHLSLDRVDRVLSDLHTRNLDQSVDFFAGEMSRRRIVILLNDHFIHHRGELLVYLRLLGIDPPDYVGW